MLIWASQNNRLGTTKKALASGADVNTFGSSSPGDEFLKGTTYGTPLHWAAKFGYGDIVSLLLHHNARLDTPSQLLCQCSMTSNS